mmetsp:Transcript_13673/g.40640  ORF Transcript_13673/g.40640 Transcript_13673/m.40640 type:complete len:254 (+) Transcript_13673:395-1156(+)
MTFTAKHSPEPRSKAWWTTPCAPWPRTLPSCQRLPGGRRRWGPGLVCKSPVGERRMRSWISRRPRSRSVRSDAKRSHRHAHEDVTRSAVCLMRCGTPWQNSASRGMAASASRTWLRCVRSRAIGTSPRSSCVLSTTLSNADWPYHAAACAIHSSLVRHKSFQYIWRWTRYKNNCAASRGFKGFNSRLSVFSPPNDVCTCIRLPNKRHRRSVACSSSANIALTSRLSAQLSMPSSTSSTRPCRSSRRITRKRSC